MPRDADIVPEEFAKAGEAWNAEGWRVDVRYTKLTNPLAPKSHMAVLRDLLPKRYSPILPSGRGNQSYLSEIGEPTAQVLAGLIGP